MLSYKTPVTHIDCGLTLAAFCQEHDIDTVGELTSYSDEYLRNLGISDLLLDEVHLIHNIVISEEEETRLHSRGITRIYSNIHK